MRLAALVSVAFTAGSAAVLACGSSSPRSQTPPTGPEVVAPRDAGVAISAGDAGPTSTTTQTLAGGGGNVGTRLTPQGTGDGGIEGGHAKHHAELGRSQVDLQAIIASRRDEARACYDNALAAHPGIEGNVDIRWTIDPAGNVADAAVDTSHSDILEPSVGNCLIALVKKIHFNASAKGFETKAHYPFNFHPRPKHAPGSEGGR